MILIKRGPERSTIEIEFLLVDRFINRLILNIIVLLEWHIFIVVSMLELFLILILVTSDVVVLSGFILLLLVSRLPTKNCGILLRQLSEDLLTMLHLD